MPRPRLLRAILPLVLLGLPANAEAAETLGSGLGMLLAQSAGVPRGASLYLNLLKFVPVVLIYLMWAWTTSWADKDMRDLNDQRFEMWNSILFAAGLLGLVIVFVVPIYFVGLLVLILAYFGSILAYVNRRNQTVDEHDKVLTPYHIGEILNGLLGKMRVRPIFNKNNEGAIVGVPVEFQAKGRGVKEDPERLVLAMESEFYEPAKELIYDAVTRRATDIQMEPGAEETAIAYWIDGERQAAEPFERAVGDGVVHVIKTLGGMDVADRRKPQEGAFTALCEGLNVEFQVRTSGSKGGERVAMKLVDAGLKLKKLDDLGLRPKMADQVRELLSLPEGLILFSGPQGSGKSATLYASLREIDRFLRNIITLEEPIEQTVDNVAQNEIDTRKGESFREALRTLRRQDPDVLVVGELRDQEAAVELLEATNLGKLTMATIQARDAVSGLVRLVDLGVDAEKLGSTIQAVLSQRLVRALCETCKEPYKPKPEFLAKANLPADKVDVFYRPPKEVEEICPDCGGVGYMGRTGIFELLVVDDEMRGLIRENPSAQAIRTAARKAGMVHLQDDGLRQVIQGRTSIEELMRIMK